MSGNRRGESQPIEDVFVGTILVSRRLRAAINNILCDACQELGLAHMGQAPIQPLWFVNEFRPTQIASRLIVAGIKGVCQRCIQPCIDALHIDTREAVAQGEGIVVPAPSPFLSPFPSPPTNSPPSPPGPPSPTLVSSLSSLPSPAVGPPSASPAPPGSPPAFFSNLPSLPSDSDSDGPAHVEHAPTQPQSPPQEQIPTQAVSVYQAWYRTAQWPLMYGRLQVHGYQRRQWIADPSVPYCNVNPCTLDSSTLETRYPFETPPRQVQTLGDEFDPQIQSLGIISPNDPPENHPWSLVIRHNDLVWMGRPRQKGPRIIHSTDQAFLSNVLYTAAYDLDSLPHTPHTWDYATPEYDALLGTPIGKIAAAIVLGAFPRGTRRIGRVVTWNSEWSIDQDNVFINMRFDIEMNTGNPTSSGPGTAPGSAA